MDEIRFDRFARSLADKPSRRGVLRGLAATMGLAVVHFQSSVEAKTKRKRKKKLILNAFGCVDVGGKCRGKDANCCSGICQGKKPKKGKKDKSTCVAHNVGECQAGQDFCAGNGVLCGTEAACFRTTGKASFCGALIGGDCRVCSRDSDCEAEFGPGAACVVCLPDD
jgi:hypothetical protein